MGKIFATILKIIIIIFAVVGFGLLTAYTAVSLHWTDTKGIIDVQSNTFWNDGKAVAAISNIQGNNGENDVFFNKQNYCFLKAIKTEYPGDFARIFDLAIDDKKELAQKNLNALADVLGAETDQNFSSEINSCNSENNNISKRDFEVLAGVVSPKSPFAWANSDEWNFFKESVLKDKAILDKVQLETGINERVLVAELMAEQMRLFYSDRPWFKKAIAPLKVLGSMTQFSWGVFGVKPETAMRIEQNLKDSNSVFYPGKDYENLLDFKTQNILQERFQRITDNDNYYYAYLYAALYNKEVISQWQKSGIDISNRPEILATLYNIGFDHSNPNPDPKIGGAELQIGDSTYSFGRLASEFYYSGELLDAFPQDERAEKPSEQSAENSGAQIPSLSSISDVLNLLLPLLK
jgi:hypothetical protein